MESWTWLKKGYLKKETEGMIMAAQDQAIRTRWVQKNIDRMDITETCRMCGDKEETISHIVSECKQSDFCRQHTWKRLNFGQLAVDR